MRGTESHFGGKLLRFCAMFSTALVLFCGGKCFAQIPHTSASETRVANFYNGEFSALQLSFRSSSAPKQAVIIARAYRLREFIDQPADVTDWLSSIASDPQFHPLVHAEAIRYLAKTDLHKQDAKAAEARLRSLGWIREWAILAQNRTGAGDNWKPLGDPGPRFWIDVSESATKEGQAYAAASVYAETSRTVALRLGSDAESSVSVNGVEIFTSKQATKAAFDQYAAAAQLQPGWNSIVLRFRRGNSDLLRFGLRITTPEGKGVQLKASPELERTTPSAAILPDSSIDVADLVAMAKADSDSEPRSAQKLQTLGSIELEHAREGALEHLEAAARIQSSANNWLEAAAACAEASCTFSALSAALRDDPGNERATLALADYYLGRGQVEKARGLVERAIQLAPGDFVARRRLVDIDSSVGLNNLALKLTRELQRCFPGPLWLKARIAETYANLGLLRESQNMLKSLLRDGSDDSQALKLLSGVLRETRDAEGLLAFSRAEESLGRRRVRPDRSDDSRSHGESVEADLPYLENPANLASSARNNPPNAGAASVMALSDVRVERVTSNGLSSVRIQQVFYIATEQGARQYSSQSVQYAPGSQAFQVVHARIYKSDGGIVEGREGDDTRVADASVAMYYDVRSREVRFPGVEKGDIVEFDYRIVPTQETNPYGDYFGNLVVFRTSIPETLKRYVLIAPSGVKLKVVETRIPKGTETAEAGMRIYKWEARGLAPLPNETRGPAVTEIAPYVHVSTFASWKELGRWYADIIRPQFATDEQLRDLAASLVQGKRSEIEKINAIYEFVLRNTHYVAFEFGIYSYKPYPVTQIYQRRFGDCKDKASLMIALLRQTGIEADFALLRTRRMGEIDPNAASIALFNHAIVYLPKWSMWLDGTADYYGSGELPVEDQGAMALVVAADGSSSLLKIPTTRPEDNYTRRTVRTVLANDGSMQFQGESSTRGEDAPGLRREYELPDHQRDSVRDSLAKVFPSVRVDDVHVHDQSEPERSVNVEFRGTVNSSARQRMVSLPTTWMQQAYVQRLAPLATRTQELVLPAPWMRDEELHFQLPSGAEVVSLPANTELSTKFGHLHVRYERHGHEVVIRTSLEFSAVRISPAEYATFRNFCRSIEQAFRGEVKVAFRG